MADPKKPTEAELAILRVLWSRGASTVRDVAEAMDRGAAHLPDEHFSALDDWIGSALLDGAEAHRERMAPDRELRARVFEDITDYFARWTEAVCGG